jgi:ribosomal protein S18 acetylase RimI-like enzyme
MVMVDWIERPETPYAPARKMCHIAEICVDASCRGTGIGHALLEFVRQEARKRGFPRIELDVWDFNDALGFYEKEGFTVYRRFLEQEV